MNQKGSQISNLRFQRMRKRKRKRRRQRARVFMMRFLSLPRMQRDYERS